jgi:hypothetical protein
MTGSMTGELCHIRILMPHHLRTLASVDGEISIAVTPPVTTGAVLDALEQRYPMLRGTIRDHVTAKRRPKVRFYANEQDITHEPDDTPLADAIVSGSKPFMIVGAISGG